MSRHKETPEKKRVVFTFDEGSYKAMEESKKRGGHTSLAEVVQTSLSVNMTIEKQAAEGFSEVVVPNPQTGEEKVLLIPGLETFAR